ncbi:MAG: hypothetical protein V1845_00930 [bacterium]
MAIMISFAVYFFLAFALRQNNVLFVASIISGSITTAGLGVLFGG